MLEKVHQLYEKITLFLIEREITITTMESCTSGLIASLITDTPGASAIFKGSDVTYSNEEKIASGVSASVIQQFGVYSLETAEAMAKACRQARGSHIGLGITGSLGTVDPVNADSVPGEIFMAIDWEGKVQSFMLNQKDQKNRFEGKLEAALEMGRRLLSILDEAEERSRIE